MNSNRAISIIIILGTLLLIATMVLHPVGGNIEHLRRISRMGMIAHSLAIASIPVLLFGLFRFSLLLKSQWSLFSFFVFSIASIAAVLAAAVNGLVLPTFLARYPDPTAGELDMIMMILVYNSTLNHALDWILISGFALSVVFWSLGIVKTRILPTWLAVIGFIDGLLGLWALISGSLGLSLHDFRLFMFGFALWILLLSIILWTKKSEESSETA